LTEKDAVRIVSALKSRDLIEYAVMRDAPGAEGLVTFLQRFWNYEESPYVREKLLHHHRIGRRHCYDQEINVQTYWKPFFKERRLAEIRKADLKDFSFWLEKEKQLKSKTINNVLAAGTVALALGCCERLYPCKSGGRVHEVFGGFAEARGSYR
jgi:hypothetical protein